MDLHVRRIFRTVLSILLPDSNERNQTKSSLRGICKDFGGFSLFLVGVSRAEALRRGGFFSPIAAGFSAPPRESAFLIVTHWK